MKALLQYFFLLFMFNISTIIITCANTIPAVQHQQLLLLNFKKTFTFPDFSPTASKFISWNSSTDCCSWMGVTCSTNGHVVGLDISNQSISGGIDNSSSLFDLQQLQSLNLANNIFSYGSRIPSAIGKLTNSRPFESPNLSMVFHNLTDLTEIYLDGVNISAQGNEWCQAISSSLPNLRVLSLSNTLLSGHVDRSLTKLQSLSVIQLDRNEISGPIPGFFANFSNMRVFRWGGNNICAPVLQF
ncbi:receptor-like protein 11 [Malus domestica]|uniref:receptor-like protein 11 n=1 Tax=Malus domestica TaxID=3750 RepID=UPI0010AA21B2|nr:receptor-like protein 11 [Malus domestica]